ncbi:MAG: AAA family ATPase, partial [Alphaproteobacteria bacterium]
MPGGVITQDQSRLLAYLKTAGVLGNDAPTEITTSGAHILLTGGFAYKLRRAITYSYMDFGTLEDRNRAAVAELRLNRITAPDLYLGLMPIATDGDTFKLRPIVEAPETGNDIIEHLVVMHRFDEHATLDQLADRNTLDDVVLDQLASRVARFHDQTAPILRAAAAQKLADVSGRTMRDLLAARSTLGEEVTTLLHQGMQVSLIQAMNEVDERGTSGQIKRLHGDLHLANVVLIDGAPVIFDALEFDDAMATIDELHDIAFLIMDIWARGLPEQAARVWSRYLAERDDYSGLALAPLYIAMRAAVRAKVALNAASLNAGDGPSAKVAEAIHYVTTALAALKHPSPRLIVIGGLSGTGKTPPAGALAPALAPAVGAVHLRSDA